MKRNNLLLILFLNILFVFSYNILYAKDDVKAPIVIDYIGHIGGTYKALYISGNYLYCAEGPELKIFDISNQTNPTLLGNITFEYYNTINSIIVNNDYAFVGVYSKVYVLNVSNKAKPIYLNAYSTKYSYSIKDMFIKDKFLYIVGSGYLELVDVQSPSYPIFKSNIKTKSSANGVYVLNNYAYIADGDYFTIINVENPITPSIYNYMTLSTYYSSNKIYINNNLAYIVGDDGLRIIDISNPNQLSIKGSYISTNIYFNDLYLKNSLLYIADSSKGITIIDVGNPESPSLINFYQTPGTGFDILGISNTIYLADTNSVQIFDISDGNNPVFQNYYGMKGDAYSVVKIGNYAYVANYYGGIEIVDVSNPRYPIAKAKYDTDNYIAKIAYSNNLLFVANKYNKINILNINDPLNPQLTGTFNYPNDIYSVRDIYIKNNLAYLAGTYGDGFVAILDISNPTTPFVRSVFKTISSAYSVFVEGGYAYAAIGYRGIQIIDISNPDNPSHKKEFDTNGFANDIFVKNNIAFVADDYNGVVSIDVSNPLNPILKGTYKTQDSATNLFILDNYAYIGSYDGYGSDHSGAVAIAGIFNPSYLTSYRLYRNLNIVQDIYADKNMVYVADNSGGLLIYSGVPTPTPSPTPSPTPTETPVPKAFITEYLLAKNIIEPQDLYKADINKDSNIDIADEVTLIGRITPTPTASPTPTDTPTPSPTPTPSMTPTPTPLPEQEISFSLPGNIDLFLRRIKAGAFNMGSNNNTWYPLGYSKPIHQVSINYDYYISRNEITQKQWTAIVGSNPSNNINENNPVENVSWEDCQIFINNLNTILTNANVGYITRLPSEAEWEFAVRDTSQTQTLFFFGDSTCNPTGCPICDLENYSWFCTNSGGNTNQVGQKIPNFYGLYDVYGNVWEWCEDNWHSNYNGAPSDGSAWVDEPSANNTKRVIRGGSCNDSPTKCSTAYRYNNSQASQDAYIGFRIVAIQQYLAPTPTPIK